MEQCEKCLEETRVRDAGRKRGERVEATEGNAVVIDAFPGRFAWRRIEPNPRGWIESSVNSVRRSRSGLNVNSISMQFCRGLDGFCVDALIRSENGRRR